MVAWGKLLTKREGEDEHEQHTGSSVPLAPKGAASLELVCSWVQSCSILSLMPIAQIHRKDPGSLEHRDLVQKEYVRAQPLS